jgi:hypothetical protein
MLIKLAQGKDVFVYDFVNNVKLTHQELFKLYCNPFTKYENPTFDDFNFLFTLSNDAFPMS